MRLFVLALVLVFTFALDNGVGRTPPMGWNSWNHFGCNINENLIKQTADLIVSTGLAAKGYKYVNLDDCWQVSRDPTTHVIIQDSKFPSGMAKLGDYIHSKGLLYGLYSDAGFKTCAGRPGSLGYETIDAQTYASWGVDYLKYDNCNTDGTSPKVRYPVMRDALNKTGRRIFFSMCEWGVENPATWSAPVGNSWRTTGDISDNWNSFVSILDKQAGLEAYSGPGAWNDPDMLEVGNGGMTSNENEAHFVLWAVLKSPLLIGCDLSKMTNDTLRILGNEEVIAVNQDKLGKQVKRVKQETNRDYFVGPLSKDSNNNDRYVVVLFNRGTAATDFVFTLSRDIGLPTTVYATVRDIVNHKDLPDIKTDTASYASIPGRSVHALVLTILSKAQAISLTEA